MLTEVEGLPNGELNGRISHPGACVDDHGHVWFATTSGLTWTTPSAVTDVVPLFKAAIEEVRADGRILASTFPPEPEGGWANHA